MFGRRCERRTFDIKRKKGNGETEKRIEIETEKYEISKILLVVGIVGKKLCGGFSREIQFKWCVKKVNE